MTTPVSSSFLRAIVLGFALVPGISTILGAGLVNSAVPDLLRPTCSNPTGISHNSPYLSMRFSPTILTPASFKPFVDRFNAEDVKASEGQELSIQNSEAWQFLDLNIPWFDCPDKQLEETYYYRWWLYRKHLKKTPEGWVVTEFLPPVGWAGIYNTISCAAGHHLYEGRWLRDSTYVEDYAKFWMLPEAQPRNYSFWSADAMRAVELATGNKRFAEGMLPNLVAHYRAWERTHRDPNGLFHQVDDRDGMEYSLGGSGYRPSINAYMYGDARAIAEIATENGQRQLADEFKAKAREAKSLVQSCLWNPKQQFFETVNPNSQGICGVREEIGFIPWYFNLPDSRYDEAWKQLLDPQGFAMPFGPPTAERRAKGFMHPENHDCLWNGPSWPYATTQTLVAMANLINSRPHPPVSKQQYLTQLQTYARSQTKNGRPWVAEDLDPETGKWIVDLPRSVCYNHSGFCDLIISGLVGLRPQPDNRVVVNPLVPSETWDWFCLDAVPYHGKSITVLWDRTGNHYHRQKGLTLLVDGEPAAHRGDLGELTAKLPSMPKEPKVERWQKYPTPVLGGSLGTCFDIALLEDDGKYKMYFSWRPKHSVTVVESIDGIHWSEPTILISPSDTGWEDDINRPAVVKQNDLYHMWYTGQFHGHSSIGYATSRDGLHWDRNRKPVMEADRAWEKVAVMCPSVIWDGETQRFRMWYSGGDQYEPDAIGYAVSPDGIHWTKSANPVFEADPASRWERYKVTACDVMRRDGWFYMFYIGFRDIDHAQIGIARSKDGVTDWQRLKDNPIISPTVDGWDADACYKPFVLYDKKSNQWLLWYNGRHGGFEQIGRATRPGPGLGF